MRLIAFVPLLLLVSGCASDERSGSGVATEATGREVVSPEVAGSEVVSPAVALATEIDGALDSAADLSVFVLDGDVTYAGPLDRRYSFDSLTKTIVGLVLAGVATDGVVALDDPISEFLDAGDNGDITLLELATHASRLPRLAPNSHTWEGFTLDDPYAGYTAALAEDGLRAATRDDQAEYSNFGFQVLGLALERATGETLGALAEQRVFEPAGMTKAALPQGPTTLPDGVRDGQPVAAWTAPLGGAGGAEGTIEDLAVYARFLLDPPDDFEAVVADTLRPRRLSSVGDIGLAWIHVDDFAWHNGGSAAYSSLLVLDLLDGRAAGFLASSGDSTPRIESAVLRTLRERRG